MYFECPSLYNYRMVNKTSESESESEVKENNQTKNYIGLTEQTFKQRYNGHNQSFNHEKHENSTELSKHVWQLKRKNKPFSINWSIIRKAHPYSNESKRCNLCLNEKLAIVSANKRTLLNKRSELISKCRHINKFHLSSFKGNIIYPNQT